MSWTLKRFISHVKNSMKMRLCIAVDTSALHRIS
jgi:hypothetical protein